MSPLPRMKPIVPWWQIGLLLALCTAGIYFLLPDDPQLIDTLVRDRNTREARRLLEKIPPAQRARDADRYRVLELELARQELPPPNPADPAPRAAALEVFWRHAITAWHESRFAAAVFRTFAPVIPQLPNPATAWEVVAPEIDRAPAGQRASLIESFTRSALAHGQPALAAEIFARGAPPATRTPAQALELARLWQSAGHAANALAALDASASPHEPRSPEIEAQRLPLLRALNRNREALDLLRARLEASDSQPPDAASTEEFGSVALAAGAPAEAVPVYERYVEANPNDLGALRRLRALWIAAGQPEKATAAAQQAVLVGSRQHDDLVELARIHDWSNQPGPAFDVWFELALKNHPGAIDRLLALNPGLFRDTDLARALEHVVATTPRDEHVLALARLNVELGRYGRARQTFERFLTLQADPAVMLELARLHRENFEFAEAEAWMRRAAASRPADADLRREIADLLVYQKRHAEALAAYGELVQQSDAENIIGPFTRLAEELGRFDEFARGLQRRVDTLAAPSERDFVLLAYAYELAAKPAERRTAIEEGLRRHPASNDLLLQMAYLLAAARDYPAAQQTLARHSRLREDIGAATLYLDLLWLNNDLAAERHFLGTPLASSIAGEETVLERVARAREQLRDYTGAATLWRELHARRPDDFARASDLARALLALDDAAEAQRVIAPFLLDDPAPPALKLAAEIAAATGDHRAAERYQLAYLEATRSAPATDWGTLGDIRLALGDHTGAKLAFTEALRRMHARITSKGEQQ